MACPSHLSTQTPDARPLLSTEPAKDEARECLGEMDDLLAEAKQRLILRDGERGVREDSLQELPVGYV